MKKVNQIIIFSIFILLSCKNEISDNCTCSEYTISEGLILRYDYAECVCCGGWIIEMNNDTLLIFKSYHEMDSILFKKEMPVKVSVSWKLYVGKCQSPHHIEVNSFWLR